MRTPTILAAALALAASAPAQLPVSESFSTSVSGVFPPAGWTTQDSGTPEVWDEAANLVTSLGTLTADAAAHEYSSPGNQCESFLVSPQLDFSSAGAPGVEFDHDIYWVLYMAHTGSVGGGFANGVSTLEVSTDGGATWGAPVWTFAGTTDGLYPDEFVDLSAYAGNGSVTLGWHYSGDFAHDWGVDDVLIDDGFGGGGPTLAINGSCPGVVDLQMSGMTPNRVVAVGYSLGTGTSVLTRGSCAGITIDLATPHQTGGIFQADANGDATLQVDVPAAACGNLTFQALDIRTCTLTNPASI